MPNWDVNNIQIIVPWTTRNELHKVYHTDHGTIKGRGCELHTGTENLQSISPWCTEKGTNFHISLFHVTCCCCFDKDQMGSHSFNPSHHRLHRYYVSTTGKLCPLSLLRRRRAARTDRPAWPGSSGREVKWMTAIKYVNSTRCGLKLK